MAKQMRGQGLLYDGVLHQVLEVRVHRRVDGIRDLGVHPRPGSKPVDRLVKHKHRSGLFQKKALDED